MIFGETALQISLPVNYKNLKSYAISLSLDFIKTTTTTKTKCPKNIEKKITVAYFQSQKKSLSFVYIHG